MPAIVEAAAGAFRGVDNVTVLNGAQGMIRSSPQAGSAMQLANQLLANPSASNGAADAAAKLAPTAAARAPGVTP
jgi:hypothetical protein